MVKSGAVALMRVVGLVGILLTACGDEPPRPRPFEVAQQCRGKDLGCPRPILGVANLRASLAYYRDALGFTIDWEWGSPPDFASVTRGDATIFLSQGSPSGVGAMWMFTRNVDRLHDELKKRKATIKMPPTNMPWGARELHVLDRDGNLLRFGGPEKKEAATR